MSIDFMILGAQKAATSALQAALRNHPEIHMPKGESTFFEDPDFATRPWEAFGAGQPARLKGIKRPDSLCSKQSMERIAQTVPEARFIVVLREPVSRAISSYCYLLRHAHLPALSLNDGLERCFDAFEAGEHSRAAEVLRFGLYGAYLRKWQTLFPRERFLVLSQKQVSGAPETALGLVAEHLEVSAAPLFAALRGGAIGENNTGLYDPAMLRLARLGSTLKTRPLPGTVRRVPRSLPPRAIGFAITRLAEELARRRGQARESLSPEMRARMEALYASDMPALRACAPAEAIYWNSEAF
ncbi:sulfotransferase [Leisingera aquaemixtae]|uniref:sulfotransferase family protein n=1 Tax=Leisingera aquaemixtae TaxID=1396826 RepID=UPI001C986908|nr:sulfotransferase [Leisingera aquaemixtae]MBY6069069.1 sulfotransferase [Leisingera aquaemixtae]